MIIEPMMIHGKSLVFVHFDEDEHVEAVQHVMEAIANEVDSVTTVISVFNGKPNPQNPAGAYIIKETSEAALSAMMKLAEKGGPGALLLLTEAEFEAFTDPDVGVKV